MQTKAKIIPKEVASKEVASKEIAPKEVAFKKIVVKKKIAALKVPTPELQIPVVSVLPDAIKNDEKARQQLSNILGISISQARCATHLKQALGDLHVEKIIAGLRLQIKAANENDKIEIKKKITEASKNLIRISSDTSVAMATAMDFFVKEFIRHGFQQASAKNSGTMSIEHLKSGTITNLALYPLFSRLDVFKNTEEENKNIPAVVEGGFAPFNPKGSASFDPKGSAYVENEQVKTSFVTYVKMAIKEAKNENANFARRTGTKVCEYLSDLIVASIERLALLARIVVQQAAGVRTMNAGHIKVVIDVLMMNEGYPSDRIAEIRDFIDKKLEIYRNYVKNEKAKKMPTENGKSV